MRFLIPTSKTGTWAQRFKELQKTWLRSEKGNLLAGQSGWSYGYDKGHQKSNQSNSRKRIFPKRGSVLLFGNPEIAVPRDRRCFFNPMIVPNGATWSTGSRTLIVSLYAQEGSRQQHTRGEIKGGLQLDVSTADHIRIRVTRYSGDIVRRRTAPGNSCSYL